MTMLSTINRRALASAGAFIRQQLGER